MIPFFIYWFLSNIIPFITLVYHFYVGYKNQRAMHPLAMQFEGTGIKENNRAERTQQFHVQKDMMHMGTDGGMGGQGSLRAPLYPAALDPLGVTYVDMYGCHLSVYISFFGFGDRYGNVIGQRL